MLSLLACHFSQTGVADAETIKMMQKPRCGQPDYEDRPERKKRYVLEGSRFGETITWDIRAYTNQLPNELIDKEVERAFRVSVFKSWTFPH